MADSVRESTYKPGSTAVRLPPQLKTAGTRYAHALGVSLNSLMAVALAEYLRVRVQGGAQ